MKPLFFCFTLLICVQFAGAQNPTIQALTAKLREDESYWDDLEKQRSLQDSVIRLYERNLSDSNSLYLLRYYLSSVYQGKSITDSTIRAAEALIGKNRTVYKNWYYYGQLSACYTYIGLMARITNDLALKKHFYDKGLAAVNAGLSLKSQMKNHDHLRSLLVTKTVLLTNIGGLVYQSTNHKDPIDKRNEIGPIIEKYWLEADSIENVISGLKPSNPQQSWSCDRLGILTNNLLVFYGYYYPNETKAKFYYQKAIELSKSCGDVMIADRTLISLGWIQFCREDFTGCIPYFVKYLQKYPDDKSSFVQDARYALVESYYNLGKKDSVISYGNAYFRDTVYFKDYLFLSMASMYMTETYMELGKTDKAIELLHLSKEFMAKSQHESVLRQYRNEGEEIMQNTALNKISELSVNLESNQTKTLKIQIVGLSSLLVMSLFIVYYCVKKLRTSPVSRNANQ